MVVVIFRPPVPLQLPRTTGMPVSCRILVVTLPIRLHFQIPKPVLIPLFQITVFLTLLQFTHSTWVPMSSFRTQDQMFSPCVGTCLRIKLHSELSPSHPVTRFNKSRQPVIQLQRRYNSQTQGTHSSRVDVSVLKPHHRRSISKLSEPRQKPVVVRGHPHQTDASKRISSTQISIVVTKPSRTYHFVVLHGATELLTLANIKKTETFSAGLLRRLKKSCLNRLKLSMKNMASKISNSLTQIKYTHPCTEPFRKPYRR